MLKNNIIRGPSIQWEGVWGDGTSYIINNLVENNGIVYNALTFHTSTFADEPGYGVNWETHWNALGEYVINIRGVP